MDFTLRSLCVFVAAITGLLVDAVGGEFELQPKIRSNDGILMLEAVRDRNITLRLVGESTLMFGDLNVVQLIETKLAPLELVEEDVDDNSAALLKDQLLVLKNELQIIQQTLSRLENGTGRSRQFRRINRDAGRIMRLGRKIDEIERTLEINECSAGNELPCKNGGDCYDGYNDFRCECPEGWTGKNCEEDIDECYKFAGTGLGCQNNGACINTLGSYRCSCRNGFSGTHCRLKDAICESSQSAELCGHGVCVQDKSVLGYTCICNQGWTNNNATPTCAVDVDECAMPTNPCHSVCINLPGSYKCGPCPRGFTGDGITCTDINECLGNNGGCSVQPKVTCINTEGSYRCGRCPPGWTGDGHTCTQKPSNSCDAEGVCHPSAKCQYISGTAVCTCPFGTYGHGFGSDGCSAQPADDPCAGHQCKNNGLCVISGLGTRCSCPAGYMGPLCEQEEACHSNPCQNGGTCNQLADNKFRCSCQPGSTGLTCEIIRTTCGSVIRQELGEFSYPPVGASITYEAFERCAWIIRTLDTKVLNITFERFDLEESPECNRDWLQIHDGRTLAAQLIGRFCGKSLPLGGSFLSSHNQLFFWFRSDNTTHGSGFKFTWHSQEHVCGGNIDLDADGHTLIRSPGYPGKTPADRECEWKVSAPFGNRLVLRFYEVKLGGNINCTQDTIKVFDSDRLLRELCESAKPEPIHTSSSQVVVHLHTDAQGVDSAFQLHIEVVPGIPNCGGLFTESTGAIVGYMNADVCLYLIQQPVGTKIQLQFTAFDLMTSDDCHLQRIEVYNGRTDDDDKLLKVLCGKQENLEPLESTGNFMLVRYEFSLAGFELNKKFEATYKRVCGERYFGPGIGTITTPNYPKPYYEHLNCVYDIYGPLDTVVNVNFTDFSLTQSIPGEEPTSEDNINYVDVYLSNDNKRRYYKGGPMHLVSERNHMRIVFNGAMNSQRARGIRIDYDFDDVTCGGVLTQNSWSTTQRLISQIDCEWVIEAAEGQHIELKLRVMHIGGQCENHNDFVYLYANNTITGEDLLLGRYCETRIQEAFYYNVLSIIRRSSMNLDFRGFVIISIAYDIVNNTDQCGGEFSARFGVITSPSWPKPYTGNFNCKWIISAPMGNKIELRVQNFSLETSFGKCSADVLRIRNGKYDNSPLIGEYCGTTIPARIPSFGNGLYLQFHSDASVSDSGFHITWEQAETGCGGKLNSHIGAIHSPHYADVDAGPVICEWRITTSESSTIDIELRKANPNVDLCNSKTLVIYDGPISSSRQLQFNCSDSDRPNFQLHSTGNDVLVRYSIDESIDEGVEFLLDYKTNCNLVITDKIQGVIESPNFPDNYPPSTNCLWDIKGGRNNKIKLIFSHLQVELRDEQCQNDFVQLIDMRDDIELSRRNLCVRPIDAITSEGNRMQVRFVSDFSEDRSGFRAEFKRLGCGEHFHIEAAVINTPSAPYSVNVDCVWYIEVSAGKQIVLNFFDLHIETDSSDCNHDSITVAESNNSTRTLLHECQVQQMPVIITMPANRAYIHFVTSEKRARKYFKMRYYVKDASCGGSFRSAHGIIASPNYPNLYTADLDCEWDLRVEDSYNIKLKIDVLEFQFSNSNCYDAYVEINSTKTISRFCGPDPPSDPLEIAGNQAYVSFRVKSPNSKGKFLLQYERSCSRNITDVEGYLKSLPSESCNWTINAPEGSHISIDILHLQCDCANETNCRGVSFHPGSALVGNNRTGTFDFCQNHQTNIIIPSNSLTIEAQNVNFRAKYATMQSACGGILTSLQGYLVSPYYPKTYPPDVECTWTIEASRGSYLELSLDMLDIAMSEHCNGDYLEIRTHESGPLLGLYCGQEVPTEPMLAFEKAWIQFRSIGGSTGNGFKLNWKHAHANELNNTSGEIIVPPLLAARQQENEYTWRIMVSRGQYISLNILEYNTGLNLYDGFDSMALHVEIPGSPWTFFSSSNVLYMTTNNDELDIFRLKWNTVNSRIASSNVSDNQCSESFLLSSNKFRNISSPGYPYGYADNLICSWIVKPADETQHIEFSLYEADLEDRPECSMDYVRVSTSADMQTWNDLLTTCSGKAQGGTPMSIVHGTPALKVEFKSDVSVNGTGFTSLVKSICGSNMTGAYGALLETQLKDIYDICVWYITVRPGKRIAFTFQYKSISDKSDDCHPYALVYDGIDEYAPILNPGHICKKTEHAVKTLETTSNHAVVKYNLTWNSYQPQPSEYTYVQWNLTYREIGDCDEEIRLTDALSSVNISTPRYPDSPHPHTECTWTIMAPVGESLRIDFTDRFDMNRRFCPKEYVEVFDGSTTLARKLGQFCSKPTQTLQSTGNVLLIHYVTDISEPRPGFRAQVSINVCGGFYSDSYGFIMSKEYPALGSYPKMTECEYTIRVYQDSRIRLNFTDIHLPYDAKRQNASDRIEIIWQQNNESTESIAFFGNITKMPYLESESNEVRIRFITYQGGSEFRGFRLRYDRIGGLCYRSVNGEQGILTLSRFSLNSVYLLCRWRIEVPKGQRVRLEFLEIKLNTNALVVNETQPQKFTFYHDATTQSKITEFNLDNYNSSMAVIESTDNVMVVMIRINANTVAAKARYTSFEETPCPPQIGDSTNGLINIESLRNYHSFYCELLFTLVENETISFKIKEMTILRVNMVEAPFAVRFRDKKLFMPYKTFNTNETNLMVSLSPKFGSLDLMQNNAVSLLKFTAEYKRHACGGIIFVLDNFVLEYPNIITPYGNYGELECAWSTRGARDMQLLGNISFSDSCEREYIVINRGFSPGNAELARICRDTAPAFSGVRLGRVPITILYHAEDFRPGLSNFRFTFTRVVSCGGQINVNIQSSEVKVDQKLYKNNTECIWEYEAPLGLYLSVNFLGRFFVEDSPNCTKDYVQVQRYDGGLWTEEGRFCGREVPTVFNSTSNRIQVIFHTDNTTAGDGFRFVVMASCIRSFNVTSELQEIVAPRIPMRPRRQCYYTFITNTKQVITVRLEFLNFGLSEETSQTDCTPKMFKVSKTNEAGEKVETEALCNTGDAVYAYNQIDLLPLMFTTRLHRLQYALSACGGNITAPATITPPMHGHNEGYLDSMRCLWYITAPPEHSVVVRFKYFDIEYHTECEFDSVTIYGGSIYGQNVVSKLCGNLTDPEQLTVVVDNRYAIFAVVSDSSSNTFRGFAANVIFTRNCNERISLNLGNTPVTLTRELDFNKSEELLCTYNIIAPSGYRINIEFKKLQLNTDKRCTAERCSSCNHFELQDSTIAERISMGKYCTNDRENISLTSSGRDLILTLNAEEPGHYRFEIVLQIEKTLCSAETDFEFRPGQTLNIIFPPTIDYPLYPPNVHCQWRINGASALQISFQMFELQNVSQVTGKCVDYLLFEVPEYMTKDTRYFCGNATGYYLEKFVSDHNPLDITFHSDTEIEGKGFHIVIKDRSVCNQTLTQLSYYLKYDGGYEEGMSKVCIDEIRVPTGYNLNFYISAAYLSDDNNCNNTHLKIIDLHNNKTLFNYCESTYDLKTLFTTTNAVQIHAAHFTNINALYVASNASLPPGCGGIIYAPEGDIVNPPYDIDHRNFSTCRWDITVPEPNRIQFVFLQFNMGSTSNCQFDYIKIIDYKTNGAISNRKHFCGSDYQDDYITTSNHAVIEAQKSPNFDGLGWRILFSMHAEKAENNFVNLRT